IRNPLVNDEARYDRFRNFLRPGAWREQVGPGSGIHYDLGAHLIDQALQLFGRPDWVFADLRTQRESAQAIDDFEFILSYKNLKVSLKGQMLAKEATSRYALYGWNGSFVKPGVDPQEELLRAGKMPHLDPENWGREKQENYGRLSVVDEGVDKNVLIPSETGSGQDFYNNLVETLNGPAELIVTAPQARDVIRILEMTEQSAQEMRAISTNEELVAY